jgi:hypothetical protein
MYTVDLDPVEVRDVDQHAAIAEGSAAPGMAAAPDGKAKPVSAGEIYGCDDVGNARDTHDGIGAPLRRELIPHQRTASALVVVIVASDHPSLDGSRQGPEVHGSLLVTPRSGVPGTVQREADRDAAATIARRVAGVRDVRNQIRVEASLATPGTSAIPEQLHP